MIASSLPMEAMEAGTLVAEKYQLVRQIGRGGMGAVWAARNIRTDREVALKLITDENADYRSRLLREARACGRITHRNVIEIYDVGETTSGAPFLVMPLLHGEPLSRRLKRQGPMLPPIAAQIASDIARALSAAHAAGIVHRDLKPANVFLHRESGSDLIVVKVLDFGISKGVASDSTTTTTGTILGSPAYMSPEQAKGERYVDSRSDLWSVGVTLFEMLAGFRPFQGESMFTVVAAVLNGPIPRVRDYAPHVDPHLAEVIARCMERDLGARIQSADEIVHYLRPHAAGYLPADLSSFATSGYHPAASISQMPTSPQVVSDSASMPPVHFAPHAQAHDAHAAMNAMRVQQPSAPAIEAPPPLPAPPRAPMVSIPGIGTSSASISGVSQSGISQNGVSQSGSYPSGVHTPPSNTAEPFSGSTTASIAMVHPASGSQPAVAQLSNSKPGFQKPLWIVGGAAFFGLAVLGGVAIGLSAKSDGGPATSPTSAEPNTKAATPTATAATQTATASTTEAPQVTTAVPTASASASVAATAAPTTQRSDVAPRPTTSAKPTASSKAGKPPTKGVGVPDDPG
ncbi:MAG: serine/threonine protein kinase [Polyangiaceae bacterium]|nr:serine/threonine protein kinase [Polyangiaceae bacterium]